MSSIPTWEQWQKGKRFNHEKGETMELNYNKEIAGKDNDARPRKMPGEYWFEIKNATAGEYNGKDTINLELEVDQGGAYFKAFDTIYLTDKAIFRLKNLCDSIGIELPDQDSQLLGGHGLAKFSVSDQGHFKADFYNIPKERREKTASIPSSAHTEAEKLGNNPEDIPF